MFDLEYVADDVSEWDVDNKACFSPKLKPWFSDHIMSATAATATSCQLFDASLAITREKTCPL